MLEDAMPSTELRLLGTQHSTTEPGLSVGTLRALLDSLPEPEETKIPSNTPEYIKALGGRLSGDTAISTSVWSEWSTNYRTSNIPGPGRNLGNFYSKLGMIMERTISQLFTSARNSELRRAEASMRRMDLWLYEPQTKHNSKVCEALLRYARSKSPSIQSKAFEAIALRVVRLPSLRRVFRGCCHKRGRSLEKVVNSWRKTGVNYDVRWQHLYSLVAVCLADNPVMDLAAKMDFKYRGLDFSRFIPLFDCCGDNVEFTLILEIMGVFWNGEGLRFYLEAQDIHASKFVAALRSRFEIANKALSSSILSDFSFDWTVKNLFRNVWSLEDKTVLFSDSTEIPRIALWIDIYVIHCASRSDVGRRLTPSTFKHNSREWLDECRCKLDHTYQRELYKHMLRLEEENRYESMQRFPPIEHDMDINEFEAAFRSLL